MKLFYTAGKFLIENSYFKAVYNFAKILFIILLGVLLTLYIIEAIFENSISSRLNLLYLFIIVVVLGVIPTIVWLIKATKYVKGITKALRIAFNLFKRILNIIQYSKWFAISRIIFILLLIIYLLLFLTETIWEGSVSTLINLNYLLFIVIFFGVIHILTTPKNKGKVEKQPVKKREVVTIICAGLGGGVIIWYKTKDIGWLAYLISIVGGGLIIFLSLVLWQDREGAEDSERENHQDT